MSQAWNWQSPESYPHVHLLSHSYDTSFIVIILTLTHELEYHSGPVLVGLWYNKKKNTKLLLALNTNFFYLYFLSLFYCMHLFLTCYLSICCMFSFVVKLVSIFYSIFSFPCPDKEFWALIILFLYLDWS